MLQFFFKANDSIGQGLTRQLMTMLESFGFTINNFCYVKNDGTN
jgi:hypothetical protein